MLKVRSLCIIVDKSQLLPSGTSINLILVTLKSLSNLSPARLPDVLFPTFLVSFDQLCASLSTSGNEPCQQLVHASLALLDACSARMWEEQAEHRDPVYQGLSASVWVIKLVRLSKYLLRDSFDGQKSSDLPEQWTVLIFRVLVALTNIPLQHDQPIISNEHTRETVLWSAELLIRERVHMSVYEHSTVTADSATYAEYEDSNAREELSMDICYLALALLLNFIQRDDGDMVGSTLRCS